MQGSGGDEDILLDDYDSDEDSNERDEVEYFSLIVLENLR